jgi:hypothetical protein
MKAYILNTKAGDPIRPHDLEQYGFVVHEILTLENFNYTQLLDAECIFAPVFFDDCCVLPILRNLGTLLPHCTIFIYYNSEELCRVRHCLQDAARFVLYDISSKQTLPSVIADTQFIKELRTRIILTGKCREPISDMMKNTFSFILRNFKEMEHTNVYNSLAPPMSETVFYRKFKAECGFTIKTLIRTLRMEYAEYLARSTPLSLGQVCRLCGYNNYYGFSRLFKMYHRQSFVSYRKVHGTHKS